MVGLMVHASRKGAEKEREQAGSGDPVNRFTNTEGAFLKHRAPGSRGTRLIFRPFQVFAG